MRNHSACLFTGIFLACIVAANATAQQVSTKQPADSSVENIQLAIENLGSSNFGTRTAAATHLRAMGFDAKDALGRAATDHPDADARARAADIYDDLQQGISPDTPTTIINAIQAIRFGSSSMLLRGTRFLIDNEQFDSSSNRAPELNSQSSCPNSQVVKSTFFNREICQRCFSRSLRMGRRSHGPIKSISFRPR